MTLLALIYLARHPDDPRSIEEIAQWFDALADSVFEGRSDD